jgi:hypothetical protein
MGQEELSRLGSARTRTERTAEVAATLFGGAMEELAEARTDGRIGTDLDQVIDDATNLSMAIFEHVAPKD